MTSRRRPDYNKVEMFRMLKYKPAALALGACFLALAVSSLPGCLSKGKGSDGAGSRLMKVTFSVPDMCCNVCALKSRTALEQHRGVEKAYANFLEKRAWASYDPNLMDAERLRRSLESLGFKEVVIVSDEPYVPEPMPEDL